MTCPANVVGVIDLTWKFSNLIKHTELLWIYLFSLPIGRCTISLYKLILNNFADPDDLPMSVSKTCFWEYKWPASGCGISLHKVGQLLLFFCFWGLDPDDLPMGVSMTCFWEYKWPASGCAISLPEVKSFPTKYTHLQEKMSCLWVYNVLLMGV